MQRGRGLHVTISHGDHRLSRRRLLRLKWVVTILVGSVVAASASMARAEGALHDEHLPGYQPECAQLNPQEATPAQREQCGYTTLLLTDTVQLVDGGTEYQYGAGDESRAIRVPPPGFDP